MSGTCRMHVNDEKRKPIAKEQTDIGVENVK
jgi:hypothetical protein